MPLTKGRSLPPYPPPETRRDTNLSVQSRVLRTLKLKCTAEPKHMLPIFYHLASGRETWRFGSWFYFRHQVTSMKTTLLRRAVIQRFLISKIGVPYVMLFMVDKVALGQGSLRALGGSPANQHRSTHIDHHSGLTWGRSVKRVSLTALLRLLCYIR
jgi:hypothetical protein